MRTHIYSSSQIKYGDNTTSEGVLFATYSALIGESQAGGQHRTRIRQILEWCGSAFDGVVSWLAGGRGRGEQPGMSPGAEDLVCPGTAWVGAPSVTTAGEPRRLAWPPSSSWPDFGWRLVAGKCGLAVPWGTEALARSQKSCHPGLGCHLSFLSRSLDSFAASSL